MARIRTIKPAFFRSDDVRGLSYRARLTWIGLWTYVDDDGRGRDDARIIKGELWALEDDVTWQDVEQDLTELSRSLHVVRYEVSGRRYLHIPTWKEHQVISRPTPSKFPAPEDGVIRTFPELMESSVSTPGSLPAGSGKGTGKGNREVEEEPPQATVVRASSIAGQFAEAYAAWPKKVEKTEALNQFTKAASKMPVTELVSVIQQFGAAYAATTERKFIPALGRWLNHERWTDELPTAENSKGQRRDMAAVDLVSRLSQREHDNPRQEIER